MVALAERRFDVLEVLEVRVADRLLGGVGVAVADLLDGCREHRLDLLDLGDCFRRSRRLLVGLVGAAAAGNGEQEGRKDKGQHG